MEAKQGTGTAPDEKLDLLGGVSAVQRRPEAVARFLMRALEAHIRAYRNGRDLTATLRFFMTVGQKRRLHRRGGPLGQPACGQMADCEPWLRCRLVPGCVERQGIRPCIPGRKSRGKAVRCYKRRSRIGILLGRPKDWHRIASRSGRCAKTFLSRVALAATVMFWPWPSTSLEPGLESVVAPS